MDRSYAEITEALTAYFDGFYKGDVEMLKRIFHSACHLYTAHEGPLVDDDMDAVYARVAGRTPPASTGDGRIDEIVSIDKSGPESALAKVRIAIGPKLFTDYLTMLKIDGRWRIISKTYTWVPRPAEAVRQAAE